MSEIGKVLWERLDTVWIVLPPREQEELVEVVRTLSRMSSENIIDVARRWVRQRDRVVREGGEE